LDEGRPECELAVDFKKGLGFYADKMIGEVQRNSYFTGKLSFFVLI